jgi:hypothetical protein
MEVCQALLYDTLEMLEALGSFGNDFGAAAH